MEGDFSLRNPGPGIDAGGLKVAMPVVDSRGAETGMVIQPAHGIVMNGMEKR
jgi:hypothetical protein